MNTYSSTTLNLYAKSCPHALTLAEDGAPYDRELFQTGIAVHAILQVCAEKLPESESQLHTLADSVVESLLTEGRSYNGVHEPPMSPEAAIDGRELGIEWMVMNGMPDRALHPEIGLGMNNHGQPVQYDAKEVRYRGILDLVYFDHEGDEECHYDVLVIRDYKSAWPAGENELETLQRKGQAVLAFKSFDDGFDYMAIRLEVCNLRTGMTHVKTIMLDQAGLDLLAQWEKDILMLCNVADNNREARVGSNCLGCRYVPDCGPCRSAGCTTTSVNIAVALAASDAIRQDLFSQAKLAITEGSIKAGGGTVGYKAQTRRKMQDDGHAALLQAWNTSQGNALEKLDPGTLSLIKGMKLGSTQVENMSKVLYPGRGTKQDRQAFTEECLEEFNIAQFGVWK